MNCRRVTQAAVNEMEISESDCAARVIEAGKRLWWPFRVKLSPSTEGGTTLGVTVK